MVASPRRLPDDGACDLEPDGDLGELGSDRLMFDDAASALYAQLRVVERRLVGSAANAEVERLFLRQIARGIAVERAFTFGADEIFQGHPTVLEHESAAGAMVEMATAVAFADTQAGCVGRNQEHAHAAGTAHHEREQLGQWRVGDRSLTPLT